MIEQYTLKLITAARFIVQRGGARSILPTHIFFAHTSNTQSRFYAITQRHAASRTCRRLTENHDAGQQCLGIGHAPTYLDRAHAKRFVGCSNIQHIYLYCIQYEQFRLQNRHLYIQTMRLHVKWISRVAPCLTIYVFMCSTFYISIYYKLYPAEPVWCVASSRV